MGDKPNFRPRIVEPASDHVGVELEFHESIPGLKGDTVIIWLKPGATFRQAEQLRNLIGDLGSRVQITKMRTSSVEFCLDWLTELNQSYCRDAVCDIASALMLMVVHDEQGVVEDLSEINYIGFKTTKVLQTQTFENYYSEIMPILTYLKKCDRFESAIAMVIELWDEHRAKAPLLREKDCSSA